MMRAAGNAFVWFVVYLIAHGAIVTSFGYQVPLERSFVIGLAGAVLGVIFPMIFPAMRLEPWQPRRSDRRSTPTQLVAGQDRDS
jgi:hypothetical protein